MHKQNTPPKRNKKHNQTNLLTPSIEHRELLTPNPRITPQLQQRHLYAGSTNNFFAHKINK